MTKVKIRNVAKPSMEKAIRAKCLSCSGGQNAEVEACPLTKCPLWPYRFGVYPATYIEKHENEVKIIK